MISTQLSKETQFILCQAGGFHFAVEAIAVAGIAESNWKPPAESEGTKKNQVFHMAALLNLKMGKGTRTLVLQTDQGAYGVVVESIAKEEFMPNTIKAVPPLLQEWIHPPVIMGFAVDEDSQQITSILDIQRLVVLIAQENKEP